MSKALVLAVCILAIASTVHAADPAARDAVRAQQFAQLHGVPAAPSSGFVNVSINGQYYTLFATDYSITGDGPWGRISVSTGSSSLFGFSGDRNVNLFAGGLGVSGQGARGSARLSVFANTISGSIGIDSVNVNVFGNTASGYIGASYVRIMTAGSLTGLQAAYLLGLL